MSKTQDTGEHIKFLVSCIHNASGGKPNFQAVADQIGIVSKAAAQKRYERLLKAYDVGASTKAPPKDEAPAKTGKRKAPARGAGKINNKKAKEVESDEDVKPPVKEKAASPSGSESTDPLASEDEA